MISSVYYKNHYLGENVSVSIVLGKLLNLDILGRVDFSGCHLEEIWLFVTGLFHLNGNVRKASAFLVDSLSCMNMSFIILDFLLKLKEK